MDNNPPRRNFFRSKIFVLLIVLVLSVAIPLTVYISQQRQEIRQRAATGSRLLCTPENPIESNGHYNSKWIKVKNVSGEAVSFKVQYNYCFNTDGVSSVGPPYECTFNPSGGSWPYTLQPGDEHTFAFDASDFGGYKGVQPCHIGQIDIYDHFEGSQAVGECQNPPWAPHGIGFVIWVHPTTTGCEIPTETPTPTTLPSESPTPTVTVCPTPGAVNNVRVECPYCEQ